MSNGISLLGVLGIVFVVLKLVGVIHWSWWLVTMPFWIGIAIWATILIAFFILGLVTNGTMTAKKKTKR